ncbi:MAG TPA: hypothetical protein VLR26_10315 [Frankiaceae bacterium]|nr:hypothetical protein [Frankiaceae bacterium]
MTESVPGPAPTEQTSESARAAQPEQPAQPAQPEQQGQQAELERLRAERDALAAQLDRRAERRVRRHWFRRISAAFLVLVFALLLPMATTMAWAHRTVFNADRYVATVAPLGSNPVVTTAVARQLTDQVYAAIDPQPAIAAALPPRATFLAGPISGQVKTFLGDALKQVMTSPEFATFWTNANRFAQAQVVAVLKDKSATITTQGDTVVLNLVPLLNKALQEVQPQVSAIVGKNIQLPTISGNELPAVACQKVSTALGRPLPQTCGQIPLFPASQLQAAQQSVTRFDRLTTLALILLPVLFVGSLLVSTRRRRTLLQLTIGSALTLVVTRRLVFYFEDKLTNAAKPENRDAAHAIVSTLLDRLVLITVWLLVGALVIAALAIVTGPYRWARTSRHGVRVGAVAVGTTTVRLSRGIADTAHDDATRRWVAAHRGILQAGGAVVAAVLLLFVNLSPLLLLVLAALLIAYELAVVRLAAGVPADEIEAAATEPSPVATPQQRGPTTINLPGTSEYDQARAEDKETTS